VFPPVICFGRLDALLGVGDLRRLLAPLAPSLDRHDVLLSWFEYAEKQPLN
jgi:hypothetical protein